MSCRVFITGVGVVSSLGLGRRAFWEGIVAGRSGYSPIGSFDAAPLGRTLAAQVQGFVPADHLTAREQRQVGRCGAMSLAAARMAVADAGLGADALATQRAAVVLGTTMGEADQLAVLDTAWIRQGPDAVAPKAVPRYAPSLGAMHVARAFKTRGLVLTLPAACAASCLSRVRIASLRMICRYSRTRAWSASAPSRSSPWSWVSGAVPAMSITASKDPAGSSGEPGWTRR